MMTNSQNAAPTNDEIVKELESEELAAVCGGTDDGGDGDGSNDAKVTNKGILLPEIP